MEVKGRIKRWGNSAAVRLAMDDLRKGRLHFDQEVKLLIIPRRDVISETFGIFESLRTKSGQRMKNEIRKDLHGMWVKLYFLDSYAILEIVFGNRAYKQFRRARVITSKLNLFEVHYRLLRDLGLKKANLVLVKYVRYAVDFETKDIIEASKLKLKEKKRKLSMVDCLGYVIAREHGARFLTGDREFENLKNVVFVK